MGSSARQLKQEGGTERHERKYGSNAVVNWCNRKCKTYSELKNVHLLVAAGGGSVDQEEEAAAGKRACWIWTRRA